MKRRSKTLISRVKLGGIGLHSGLPSTVSIAPAPHCGITFKRTDLPGSSLIRLSPATYSSSERCSVIGKGLDSIATVEHLLAVFFAYDITDVLVEVNSAELPVAGGSSRIFADLVMSAGLVETGDLMQVYTPFRKHVIQSNGAEIIAESHHKLEISYFLDLARYGQSSQQVNFCINVETFYNYISRARTFVPAAEAEKLLALGFGKGASRSNTLLLGEQGMEELVKNEAATHKVLDLLGDICALGRPINARITASRSGHKHNAMLLAAFAGEIDNSNREI